MPLREQFLLQPRWLVLTEALALVAVFGWIDYMTEWEFSFFIFYALPITIVVRKTDRRMGFVFAFLCAGAWCLAQFESSPYQTAWGFALAGVTRLFYFVVLVVAVAAVKVQTALNVAQIKALERTQELEREILRVSEREKQRIGQDLHDGLGPHLAAIGYAATFLADELREHARPEAEKAEKIRDLATEALTFTRGLARGIFPVQMDATGLSVALEDLAKTTSALTGVAIQFFEHGDPVVADPEAAMHLYRIAQESVSNALRHSDARTITIALNKNANSLSLVIADDGKGMDMLQNSAASIGLRSMRYRARALGAELHIDTKPNEGTIISCEMPAIPDARTSTAS